jgi:hypothetical protein
MAKIYRLTAGDKEIFRRAKNPGDGVGVNWFTSYYFGGRELRPWQWYLHHASQRQITVIGGTGSGKTVGAGISYATWAATTPRFSFMNLAPTGWQSKLMYEAILREAADRPFERFISKYIERPYPLIVLKSDYIGESQLHFMSAADSAERIQGWEGDAMNLDEAGVLLDGQWLMTMMVTRMRGNVPVPQGGFRNRLKRQSVITANYDFAPPWLWERMDRMIRDQKNFLSMQVKSSDNLSTEDIENYKLVIPEDQWGQMLDGDKPEGRGEVFNIDAVSGCEDFEMLRWAQYHLLEKEIPTPDWRVEEASGAGCVHFEMPSEARGGRQYLLVGDPGQGNPPHRNAGVVIVWDITEFPDKPATLVYFKWIYGNGSYDPFKLAYKYAWETYRPIDSLIDSTGTQKLWDEQILLNMGIWATGMDFSGQKKGMLVAAVQQVQRRQFKWPYILGIRSQLIRYNLAEDTPQGKLPQDIVAVIMMSSWYLRGPLWENYSKQHEPEDPVHLVSARETRGSVVTERRNPTDDGFWQIQELMQLMQQE